MSHGRDEEAHGRVQGDDRPGFGRVPEAPAADGKLVGIFYDPKLAGEPTHLPMVRTSPVRDNYPSLIDTVLKRHAKQGDPIGPHDAFFLFDTNKKTALTSLLAPFAKKDKVSKQFLLHKEEESMMCRYQRVRGLGFVELGEGGLAHRDPRAAQDSSEEVRRVPRQHGR